MTLSFDKFGREAPTVHRLPLAALVGLSPQRLKFDYAKVCRWCCCVSAMLNVETRRWPRKIAPRLPTRCRSCRLRSLTSVTAVRSVCACACA
jgi:hypothetical protein